MNSKTFRTIIIIAIALLLGTTPLYPIPKEIEKALKLNRINHFDEALDEVNEALKQERIKPDITSAYTIGRILYRKGELYREMAKLNVLTHIGYMHQLREGGGNPADETSLFLGIGYFFNTQYQDAAGVLSKVVNSRTVDSELLALALVYLGASYYQMGEQKKAEALWGKVSKENVLAYSTLGYIYSYFNIDLTRGEEITKSLLEETEGARALYADSLKMNHAYTLLALGRFSDAYDSVKDINLNNPIYIYKPEKKTEIRFYDLAILDSYSKIIFGESIKNLEPIVTASSGELASFACYYVAQMYLYLNDYQQALKFALRAKKLAVISSLTMIRAIACEASINLLMDKEKRGVRMLEDEITRIHGKPSSLLEMIRVVISSNVDYSKVKNLVSKVEESLYVTQWERTRRDTAILGELSFFTGRYVRALYYLERARDKGNKNKIETNDPTFLLKLSYVYYSKEYYPESLEILFSLAKNFTGIRPLQDAVQSVYSYKQKGSGEAIID